MGIRQIFRNAERQAEDYLCMLGEHVGDDTPTERDWKAYYAMHEARCYADLRARGGRPRRPCVEWVSEEYMDANSDE